MPGLNLQQLSFVLLLLTTYLGIQTQIFQHRTSIREAIEQMDSTNIVGYVILKPVLHSFKYRGPWSSCKVAIKFRDLPGGDYASSTSTPHSPYWWHSDSLNKRNFEKALENMPDIVDAEIRKYDILISIDSDNPAKVRRRVQSVMNVVETARNN